MRHPLLARIALVSFLALPAVSLAQRAPQQYGGPVEMTDAERAAAQAKARHNISTFKKDVTAEVAPFPWKAAGLAGLAFLVAGAFAIPYYRNTTRGQATHPPPGPR